MGLQGTRPIRSRLIWGDEHYAVVVDTLRRAATSVWIATANLKDVHVDAGRGRRWVSILTELDRAAQRGVELRILHASLPSRSFRDAFDALPRLVRGGLELRQCPRVHMKVVVVDGRFAYLGSANFTGAGMGAKHADRRNFELGWATEDELVIDEIQAQFDYIWRGSACAECRLREICEAPLDLAPSPPRRSDLRTSA